MGTMSIDSLKQFSESQRDEIRKIAAKVYIDMHRPKSRKESGGSRAKKTAKK